MFSDRGGRCLLKIFRLFVIVLMLSFMIGCTETESESMDNVSLTVSAAASLTDALAEISANFEAIHPHITLKFNFGSSGALMQQIEQGAPVDLFFSAGEDEYDQLAEQGLIVDGLDLIGNEIVLITQRDARAPIESFADLQNDSVKQLAIGTPDSVPVGKYAKQLLQHEKLWDNVEAKIVYTEDVRQVLSYVETGNVDAGIVYKTDAIISEKVQIVATAREGSHTPVVYPVGIVKGTKHLDEATDFFEYIQTPSALEVLESYGFTAK